MKIPIMFLVAMAIAVFALNKSFPDPDDLYIQKCESHDMHYYTAPKPHCKDKAGDNVELDSLT